MEGDKDYAKYVSKSRAKGKNPRNMNPEELAEWKKQIAAYSAKLLEQTPEKKRKPATKKPKKVNGSGK